MRSSCHSVQLLRRGTVSDGIFAEDRGFEPGGTESRSAGCTITGENCRPRVFETGRRTGEEVVSSRTFGELVQVDSAGRIAGKC